MGIDRGGGGGGRKTGHVKFCFTFENPGFWRTMHLHGIGMSHL